MTMKAKEEDTKKLEQGELEKKELKEKISQLESSSVLNQKIIDAVMQKFFSWSAWRDAQVDNFISSGKNLFTFSENFILPFFFILTYIF